MGIPGQITVEPNGNALNGIIYEIKSRYDPNPITSGVIKPSSEGTDSSSETDISNTIVEWEKSCWLSLTSSQKPFYQVYFPKRWIQITGYSLRGCSKWAYPKKWKVYGFNEENKNDQSKWDELGDNVSTSSQPYCYTNSDTCTTNYAVGTFTTKKMNKFYQYIRFVSTQSSQTTYPRFVLSGLDVFGTLSLTKSLMLPRKTICTCLRKHPGIVSSDVIVLIIGMSMIQS